MRKILAKDFIDNHHLLFFILMNIINYVLVLLAFVLFRLGAGVSLFFLLIQPALVFANYFFSQKIWQLFILSANLLLSTIIANMSATQLYYRFVSSDFETLLVGKLEVVIGIVYVLILSFIAVIGYMIRKN